MHMKIKIEELSKPTNLLTECNYDDVCCIILEKENIPKNKQSIIANCEQNNKLVAFDNNHPFFMGMHIAYAEHRPFVLSPDMIWLLICQGFSQHINNNADKFRHLFVDHDDKTTLMIRNDNCSIDNINSPWEEIFGQFVDKIDASINDELCEILTPNFSTTTQLSTSVSKLTAMSSVKPFFDFCQCYYACGIPDVTVEGTADDWMKIIDKAEKLKKYGLSWWIDEFVPILQKIVTCLLTGEVDKLFWRNMYKYHSTGVYAAGKEVDGWIVKFFPYDSYGKKNNLKSITNVPMIDGSINLPSEIVTVDFTHINISADWKKTTYTPLEIYAGFIGLEQNSETYALKPVMGWFIRKKENNCYMEKLQEQDKNNCQFYRGIWITVKTIPDELLQFKEIDSMIINFIGKIIIPDELAKVKIRNMRLKGKINKTEMKRIKKLFPDTDLYINGEEK